MDTLIGRITEINRLESYVNSHKSEFVMVYGRRRVGKTFLIRKVYSDRFTFQLTGFANVTTREQLSQFHAAMAKYATKINWQPTPAEDWFTAFRQLITYIEKLTLVRYTTL